MRLTLKNVGVMAVGVVAGLVAFNWARRFVPGFTDLSEGDSGWWPFG